MKRNALSPFLAMLLVVSCYPQQIDPMKVEPRFRAYSENRFFDDGRAMRMPVSGTIAREKELGSPELTTGLGADGAPVPRIPIPLSRDDLELGRERFDVLCAVCHGYLGDGNSVVARKMSLRPPPSLHEYRDRPPGHFYGVISRGFGFMPTYADYLPIEERWKVVGYVRVLQLSQAQPLQSVPPAERRRLQEERP